MKKPNRKCVICGNEYYYCTSGCTDSLGKPVWMASFCSENCRNIYHAVVKYNRKNITAEEARKILDTCDLSNKDNFMASTQRLIGEIYEATEVEEVETKWVNNDEDNLTYLGTGTGMTMSTGTITTDKLLVGNLPTTTVQTIYLSADNKIIEEDKSDIVAKPTNYKKKKKKRKND